jgi:hypothetical protein
MVYENTTFNGFENQLSKATFGEETERGKMDKILSQKDMQRLRELVSKSLLEVEEVDEIMNTLVSTEIKLTNFNDNDRYILGKYLLWVSEYGKRYSRAIRTRDYYKRQWSYLTERTRNMRIDIEKDYAGTFKQAVHTYCFLARSPLSIGGSLIDRLTSDKKEMKYSGQVKQLPQPQQNFIGRD